MFKQQLELVENQKVMQRLEPITFVITSCNMYSSDFVGERTENNL